MGWMADETGLDRCAANHVALTPLSHLARAAAIWPGREALAYGAVRRDYAALRDRTSRIASMLSARGVVPGDVVSTLMPNVPAQVEASFGVPAAGAVLNTINTRLDPGTVAHILGHSGAKVLVVDAASLPLAEAACAALDAPPALIEAPDDAAGHPASGRHETWEDALATGDPAHPWHLPGDEWETIALNYTSGTTGRPKGVALHHRGAYLMTFGTIVSWRMVLHPRLLTVVPLFHCNGWCHAWTMPLVGGTTVCLREITGDGILDAIDGAGVTHLGGAPIVMGMLADAPDRGPLPRAVRVFTAGAPPPAAILERVEARGFDVTHVYGLTETYGHVVENVWQPDAWDELPPGERASLNARQGVAFPVMEMVAVLGEDGAEVPADGATQGEIAMRGNAVMKGYYRDPEATAKAFAGGWFRSGDLGVRHPDGYVQIRDRAKDIIVSGGENVSSVEVESALMHHPAVALAAVVAQPDAKWGEVPCAFVELRAGHAPTEAEIVAHARTRLPGFACPRRVVFGPLPKTSTGKIQKFELRARLRAEGAGNAA